MLQLIDELTRLLLHFFHAHLFEALFLLVFIEEAGIPIPVPGDTLVMLAGLRPHMTVWYAVAVLTISSLAVFGGSSVLYGVVRRGGRPLLEKYGKYIHLSQKRLNRVEHWFAQHGPVAIIFGRLIPGLRIPATVMAGLSGIPYSVFAPTAAVAAIVWSMVYFWLGVLIHHEWRYITAIASGMLDDVSGTLLCLTGIALLIAVSGGTWHINRRRRARQPLAPASVSEVPSPNLSRMADVAFTSNLSDPPDGTDEMDEATGMWRYLAAQDQLVAHEHDTPGAALEMREHDHR